MSLGIVNIYKERLTLLPKAKAHIFSCEPKQFGQDYSLAHRTHIDISDANIVLFAPTGSLAYVLEVIEQTT